MKVLGTLILTRDTCLCGAGDVGGGGRVGGGGGGLVCGGGGGRVGGGVVGLGLGGGGVGRGVVLGVGAVSSGKNLSDGRLKFNGLALGLLFLNAKFSNKLNVCSIIALLEKSLLLSS